MTHPLKNELIEEFKIELHNFYDPDMNALDMTSATEWLSTTLDRYAQHCVAEARKEMRERVMKALTKQYNFNSYRGVPFVNMQDVVKALSPTEANRNV